VVQVIVDDPEPLMFHAEVLRRDDAPVGYVRAASYGFTLGGAVGLVMVEAGQPINAAFLATGTWDVEIAGCRYPARVSMRPLYDPDNLRIKA
jgi:4-methylaminobutanoate oxidase (formaldehyde-forming)